MDDAKQQLADKLKTANNVLVTVSRNPSVDQLASCIGLALLLNKQGKHTAAVFSGQVPSTIEFLQPEDTLEQNTDSLRDFIIALDKSKADKLRYKVEDNVVRIFITPYKTSISEADLEFSQGDFNVDVVVALGVAQQEDLDEAITAHGRILHDATVASITTMADGGLGSINWHDPQASSLSELVTELAQALDAKLLDSQIATALLTGIVSETDRFGNDKTSSQTMSASAALMAAGANQQLVASKLEEPEQPPEPEQGVNPDDGMIEIDHNDESNETPADDESLKIDEKPAFDLPEPILPADPTPPPSDNPPSAVEPDTPAGTLSSGSKLITGPPTLGGTLTANSHEESLDPVTDPLSLPNTEPPQLLERKTDVAPGFTPPPPSWTPPPVPPVPAPPAQPVQVDDTSNEPSLAEVEESVKKPEAEAAKEAEGLDDVRDEVSRALNNATTTKQSPPEPIQALNAQPLGNDLHPSAPLAPAPVPEPPKPQVTDANAPPPVPPPIPFQFGTPPQQ